MPFGPKLLKPISADLSSLRPIPDAPGYYVTKDGRVFCIREMSLYRCRDGYFRACLSVAGEKIRKGVHQLVAMAFLPSPMPGQNEVRHLDGNKQNNHLSNLAWGTRAENAHDMARHGTVKGSRNPRAILNEEHVQQIRESTESSASLAMQLGVSKSTIKAVRRGQNWSHI